ncbi:MAG: hypothetical protein J0H07_16275 [Sphingobacteriales bacterium]|nr:hypothetical protein [Sphingobacteriales bacterium]
MKEKSLATWPALLPESSIPIYNPGKSQQRSSGVVKLLQSVPPPNEKTIRDLNALASTPPFCTFRKARRYDML